MVIRAGFILLAIVLIAGLYVLSSIGDGRLSDEELQSLDVAILPKSDPISSLQLLDHNGKTFDETSLKDRWTFAFFGYASCPHICGPTMREFQKARILIDELGNPRLSSQLQLVLVSVDPERDTPQVLQAYLRKLSKELVGVTGDLDKIRTFADEVGVAFDKVGNPDSDEDYILQHSPYLVIFEPGGSCFGYIKAPFDARKLVKIYRGLVGDV